jgi:hypothetical protein
MRNANLSCPGVYDVYGSLGLPLGNFSAFTHCWNSSVWPEKVSAIISLNGIQ